MQSRSRRRCVRSAAQRTPPNVRVETVRRLYEAHSDLGAAFTPSSYEGWVMINDGQPYPNCRHTMICATCAAPVAAARSALDDTINAAFAASAAKVKVWR